MRLLLLAAVLGLVVGCSSGTASSEGHSARPEPVGSASLKALCPEAHLLVDSLVASTPDSQREFVVQLERLWDVADQQARDSFQVLLDAAKTLEKAGVGPDFYAARDRIHAAVVSVNGSCVRFGSPILHSGPHPGS